MNSVDIIEGPLCMWASSRVGKMMSLSTTVAL